MPILRSPSSINPNMFPAGYSGTQILRWALQDGTSQRLYPSGDSGLYDHKNLLATIRGYDIRGLSSYINGTYLTSSYNLSAIAGGHVPINIQSFISGTFFKGNNLLQSIIGGHLSNNLIGYIKSDIEDYKYLFSTLHGYNVKNLNTIINIVYPKFLSGLLNAISGVNLNSFINIIFTSSLVTRIHSYQTNNLQGFLNLIWMKNLLGNINGGEFWKDLKVTLLGIATGVVSNIFSFIRGFSFSSINGYLNVLNTKNLSSYVFAVVPKNLGGSVYGWQLQNLYSYINGGFGPGDLNCFINSSGSYVGLLSSLRGCVATKVPKGLSVLISSYMLSNLKAYLNSIPAINLLSDLNIVGNLSYITASIFPKVIRLSTLLKIITMEHLNLSATINVSCLRSGTGYAQLGAYIRTVYLKNLCCSVVGCYNYNGLYNLGACLGYSEAKAVDRIPISVNIGVMNKVIDRIPIHFLLMRGVYNFNCYIQGILRNNGLSANIQSIWLDEPDYTYESTNLTDKVYYLNKYGQTVDYKDIELYFVNHVKDYFYISANRSLYKTLDYEKWLLNLSSYVPTYYFYTPEQRYRIERKLFKMTNLYDLSKFASFDEAMRFAIAYITTAPSNTIFAYINVAGLLKNLSVSIRVRSMETSIRHFLPANINGVFDSLIISYTNNGIDKI